MSRTVLISNLSYNVNEDHLHEIFSTFGKVTDLTLFHDKFGHSEKRAVVTYVNSQFAATAVEKMNGGVIDGSVVSVSLE